MEPVTLALALAQFAPSILRYFGVGEKSVAVAEKVVGIAQTVSGAKTPQEALEALSQDAELAQRFNLAVLAADKELEHSFLADRKDARAHDIQVRQQNEGKNRRADVMIVCDWLGLIACLVVLTFFRKEVPGEVVALLSTIASIFGLCLRDAHQFEFGSSRGSKEKDQAMVKWVDQS
jgi:hypothetical protein